MIKPADFQFLDVSACVPDSFWKQDSQDHFAQYVTDDGLSQLRRVLVPGSEKRLNKRGVLQVCVNDTPPFETQDGETIYVLGPNGSKKLRACPERQKLIEAIACNFLDFEDVCAKTEKILRDAYQSISDAIEIVDSEVQRVQFKVAHWKAIKERILQERESLPGFIPSGRKMGPRALVAHKIVEDLYGSFKTHGPPMQPLQIYRAITAILKQILSDRGAQIAVINKTAEVDNLAGMIKNRIKRKKNFRTNED